MRLKQQSLLRNQLLLLGGATLVCLIFGLAVSIVMTQIDRTRFQNSPTLFFAGLVDQLETHGLSDAQAVALIQNANKAASFPIQVKVLSEEQAKALLPPDTGLPQNTYEIAEYGRGDAWHFPSRLVKLDGADYLSVIYRPRATPMHRIFNLQTTVMMLSIFFAALFSIFYMFYFMRKKARLAASIISQLRDGDLSARFPLGRMDEIGLLMHEFNRMADEIQTLVETIRNSELGRMRRLQELAHDLRTPVASLKNLLETLQSHRQQMEVGSQEELLNLSMKEVDYFQRLVEDLLFLAQVRDPKYAVVRTAVDLNDLLGDELEKMRANYPQIQANLTGHVPPVKGDGHLLRRLFRNAFENAFSFARSRVNVRLESLGGKVKVRVSDDGPGFKDSMLSSFGEKHGTRFVSESPKGRLSVGLGSVIIKEVTSVHCGSVAVRNLPESGAELEITLPEINVKEEFHPKSNSPR